ncbi:MAG: Asp-tRNA(Asn)/Glu-tRNA(Gln) amidotransferase subunit GatC [Gemmatimonadota bacterium]
MDVAPDQIRRIAALAGLDLDDEELDRLTGDLNDILAHVDALAAVAEKAAGLRDAARVATTYPVPGDTEGRLRPDEPGSDPLVTPPARLAPDFREGFFTVPLLASHAGTEPDEERRATEPS